jgi:hypothetical protein
VKFREVTADRARTTARIAFAIYPMKVRLLQMFLPDKNGHFPWQTKCEGGFNDQATLDYVTAGEA